LAGIYIHIPFCKQACTYCNFHFSTSLLYKSDLINSIVKEIDINELSDKEEIIESIYFGGGTPSLCSAYELQLILKKIYSKYKIAPKAEITLECNPDDMSVEYLKSINDIGVNRLSVGIQSFHEEDLVFMNRAHNAKEAEQSVDNALSAGFINLSIDLIYGAPTTTNKMWKSNVDKMLTKNIPHISAYCLTIEPKTVLHKRYKQGLFQMEDARSNEQYTYLMDSLEARGYDHYEISNFAQPKSHAKHNTNYWNNVNYLGLGPSAHGYDGAKRRWNVANNNQYIKLINDGKKYWEEEVLTLENQYNEYVMTKLRTMWGIDATVLEMRFPEYAQHFYKNINIFIVQNQIKQTNENFTLTRAGKFYADYIASELFL
jgi:oxygen-independent coproporphyrinogen-3 oxidase